MLDYPKISKTVNVYVHLETYSEGVWVGLKHCHNIGKTSYIMPRIAMLVLSGINNLGKIAWLFCEKTWLLGKIAWLFGKIT